VTGVADGIQQIEVPNWGGRGQMAMFPKDTLREVLIAEILLSAPTDPDAINPRKDFKQQPLEELAESIKVHGVVQAPIVTEIPLCERDDSGHIYKLVAGERRIRACLLNGLESISVIVRKLDDIQARAVALIENIQRENLNVVEVARAYRKHIEDTGDTQAKLAALVARSPSDISNSMRLLELPDDILDMIQSEQLTSGHARALLKHKAFPAVMMAVARFAAETNCSVRDLEGAQVLLDNHEIRLRLQNEGLLKVFGHTSKPPYPECSKCPFSALLGSKNDGYSLRGCLNPAHYGELENQQRLENERVAADAVAEQKRRRETALSDAKAALSSASGAGERAKLAATVQQIEKTPPAAIDLSKIKTEFVDLSRGSVPGGCSAECPCFTTGMYYSRLIPACLNPGRHNQLKAAETRSKSAGRRERFVSIQARYRVEITADGPMQSKDLRACARARKRALVLVVWDRLYRAKTEAKRQTAAWLPSVLDEYSKKVAKPLLDYFEAPAGSGLDAAKICKQAIFELYEATINMILADVLMNEEIIRALEYRSDAIADVAYVLDDESVSNARVMVRMHKNGASETLPGTALEYSPTGVKVIIDGKTSEDWVGLDCVFGLASYKPVADQGTAADAGSNEDTSTHIETVRECGGCGIQDAESGSDYCRTCDPKEFVNEEGAVRRCVHCGSEASAEDSDYCSEWCESMHGPLAEEADSELAPV